MRQVRLAARGCFCFGFEKLVFFRVVGELTAPEGRHLHSVLQAVQVAAVYQLYLFLFVRLAGISFTPS